MLGSRRPLLHVWIHWDTWSARHVLFKVSYASGFPGGSEVKASACNAGDLGSIPELGRSPGEGNGNPLQYSCLENPTDGGAWWATLHGVAKSGTWLSHFTFFSFLLSYASVKCSRLQRLLQHWLTWVRNLLHAHVMSHEPVRACWGFPQFLWLRESGCNKLFLKSPSQCLLKFLKRLSDRSHLVFH